METQRDWEQGAPKETGSRGLRGQTDACGCSGAELGGGASTRRWTLVRHKKGLSGYLYHPILGGLPYSAILPHSGWLELQDTCSGPPGSYSWLSTLGTGGTPPAEQLQTEKLKEGQSCISQALHPGGEHYLWHTGNAYALTSVQEALTQ